jgi:uncharacterized protein YqkB
MNNQSKVKKISESAQQIIINLLNIKNSPYFGIGIVLIIIIIILIYYGVTIKTKINNAKENAPMVIGSPVDAFNNSIIILPKKIPISNNGLEFSLNMWIYISNWDWKFDEEKNIINRTTINNETPGVDIIGDQDNFYLKLDSTNNSLISGIKTSYSQNNGLLEECIVKNIPIQKWINYVYVLNNRMTNTYLNGELVNSCALKGIPNMNIMYKSNLVIFKNNGYYGQLGKFQYFAEALSNEEVNQIYKNGPFTSKSSQSNFLNEEVSNQYEDYLKNLKENSNGDLLNIIGITRN